MTVKRMAFAGALAHAPADKRVEILRRVGEAGSISQAAREAGVSYKAAWQALDTLSNLAGAALVEKAVGGAGGGGARLTPAGERLLLAADELAKSRDEVFARLARTQPPSESLGALALRTSMRNQLPCTVKAIRREAGAVRVEMCLVDGTLLASRITKESMELLSLHKGQHVIAMCKATAVTVSVDDPTAGPANVLRGRVTRKSGFEVALELDGGQQIVGFTSDKAALRLRRAAVATVESSAVVIAVPG